MIRRLILFLLLVIGLGGILKIDAQNNSCYEQLTMRVFLSSKVKKDTNFFKGIYRTIKYPRQARVNQIEGKIEVLLLNHDVNNLELIQITPSSYFSEEIENLNEALHFMTFDRSEAFMTRFYIHFSLDSSPYHKGYYKDFLVNDNTIVILTYRIPVIGPPRY